MQGSVNAFTSNEKRQYSSLFIWTLREAMMVLLSCNRIRDHVVALISMGFVFADHLPLQR